MAKIVFKSTTASKLSELPIMDGQLIFVKDTHSILLDNDSKRIKYEQITILQEDTERTSILAPITDIFYFVEETNCLWKYKDGWVLIYSPVSAKTKTTENVEVAIDENGKLWVPEYPDNSNYMDLSNKPQLNGVTLEGNTTLDDVGTQSKIIYDATKNGLSSENSGLQNSQALQLLVDKVSEAGGGSIYIPSGQYQFASNGSQTTGEHCIKLKSNATIYGDGASTILLPTGNATNGLDMFYFNDYVDNSNPTYLENCIFRDFVIDGKNQSCTNYTSAGKGFMINLMKNCHWHNVTVKNMDATGFGVDCPINCSMEKCYAIGNGKAAEITDVGASGFGIGFGYSYDESMLITDCTAVGNKKFGIFFEHQRRFDSEKYTATGNKGFLVAGCTAEENYNNFGGIQAISALYRNCFSQSAIIHGYFFQNSEQCNVIGCYSNNDGDTSFVVLADNTDGGAQETKDVVFISCISKYPRYGAKLVNLGSTATMQRNIVKDCYFNSVQTNTILTSGTMQSMVLEDNVTNSAENSLGATVTDLLDRNNSWNSSGDYTLPIMSSAQLGGGKAVEKTTEDVPVAVDPSTGQLFVPTYPESGSGASGITVSYDAEQQAIVFEGSSISSTSKDPLSSKTILMGGDSLMYGLGWTGGFANCLKESHPNATIINYGTNGATLTTVDDTPLIYDQMTNVTNDNCDIVIFDGGGNDMLKSVETGDMPTTITGHSVFTQLYPAFQQYLHVLRTNAPKVDLFFIIPTLYHSSVLGIATDQQNTIWNNLKTICGYFGVRVIDLRNAAGFTTVISTGSTSDYMADILHYNEAGYRKMAPFIEHEILKYY